MTETFVHNSTAVYAEDVNNPGIAIAGLATVNDLVPGAIAFFNMDGTLIDGVVVLPTGEYIMIAQGRTEGTARLSTMLSREAFNFVPAQIAALPTVKSMVLGQDTAGNGALNTPAAIVEGDVAGLVIEECEKNVNDNTRTHRYEYVCATGDTDANIIANLMAQIAADPLISNLVNVVAIAGNVGMAFTWTVTGVNFQVRGTGLYQNATWVEYNVDPTGADYGTISNVYNVAVGQVVGETDMATKGVGTRVQVQALVELAMENRGNTQTAVGAAKVSSYEDLTEAGSVYAVYPCTFVNDRTTNPTRASQPFIQSLNICVESTNAAELVVIDAILQLI